MATRYKLAAAAPKRSTERIALADAIARVQAAERDFKTVVAADEPARFAIRRARDALEAAEAAIEESKKDAVDNLVNEALGKTTVPRSTVEAAQTAAVRCRDELIAAEQARDALRAKRIPCQAEVEDAKRDLTRQIQNVVRAEPVLQRLISDYHVARQTAADLGSILAFLSSRLLLPDDDRNWRADPDADDNLAVPWVAAVNQLATDPDAVLPPG